ncbi:MAG: hypothetical protein JST16_07510 [Bdellovibrionales bacterium]|nr:hypothetical protein [Bdellovibrionales bacterium]
MLRNLSVLRKYLWLSLFAAAFARAEDYPYESDDTANTAEKEAAPSEPTAAPIPREKPSASAAPKKNRIPALFRYAAKIGGEFAVFQPLGSSTTTTGTTSSSTTDYGLGFDFLVSGGWDLPYQPIFLELETGYRAQFINYDQKTHVFPLRAGVFKRERTGRDTLFKYGLIGAIDIKYESDGLGGNTFGVAPSMSLAAVWEFGSFLFQPELNIYRLGASKNFFALTGLAGIRF